MKIRALFFLITLLILLAACVYGLAERLTAPFSRSGNTPVSQPL